MMNIVHTILHEARTWLPAGLLLFLGGAAIAFGQDIRTRDLLLDDDAISTATRNTITLRSPADASLLNDYILRLPTSNGLAAGSLLYVDSYAASTAVTEWLAPSANSVLTSDASGMPVWQSVSSLVNVSQEWIDGDSIGVSGVIYAAQALQSGTADTVVVTDAGRIGVGTATPGGLVTVRGSGDLIRAEETDGTLRSVLYDDGEQDWYLGGMTGEVGQVQVGTVSGFPSLSLFRPGGTDQFNMLNHSTYTALGYNADGVVTGDVLTIAQGGNVGIGLAAPSARLHVSATTDPLRLQGLVQDLTLDSVLVVDGLGVVHWIPASSLVSTTIDSTLSANAWLLAGNSGTNPATNFVGTTDAQDLAFRTDNTEAMRISANQDVGIGTTSPQERLHISGGNILMTDQSSHRIEMRSSGTSTAPVGELVFAESGTDWFGSLQFSGQTNDFYVIGGSGPGDVDTLITVDAQGTNKGYVGIGVADATGNAVEQKLQVHDGNILLSNTGSAGELRFAEPSASGANYSALRARAQGSDILYLLPDTMGIVGDVLSVASVAGTTVTLDWAEGSSGSSGNAWLITGNSGTNASTNFLGTTDNTAFNIRVNNQRALRIDPRTASPNITGGYSGNSISTSDDGNVIAGGGVSGSTNQISGSDYVFIGGGRGNSVNTASDQSSVVGGNNNQVSSSDYVFVGGGSGNNVNTASDYSSIVGGTNNQLSSSDYVFIGGGSGNNVNTASDYSSIVGGTSNQLSSSDYVFIGGGSGNNVNTASDYSSLVGGSGNAMSSSDYGFIGAGSGNQLNSASDYSSVVGGNGNQMSSSDYGFIGGGQSNQLNSTSDYSVLVGGLSNQLTSSTYSGIGSGRSLTIGSSSDYSFIGGGQSSQISSSDWATVAGGSGNQITGGSDYSFVGSGQNNQLTSNSDYSSIVGGRNNQINAGQYSMIGSGNGNSLTSSSNYSAILAGSSSQIDAGQYSLIGGGTSNQMTAATSYSVIGGGQSNTMNASTNSFTGGGQSNAMNGADYSVLAGGRTNTVTGDYSALGGGRENDVTANYSAIPGGRGMTISGSGSFGFLGNNIGSNDMTVSDNNVSVFGNTDVWLANNDNAASQLRFYEANSATGAFPAGTNYTSLRAQAQAADIEYIFPDTSGAVGDVLMVRSRSGTQVTLDWATANEGSGVGRLIFARKTADETSSSTTLQADDHLVLSLEASRTYEISGALYVKRSTGNGSFDVAWDVPTGATVLVSFFANESKTGNSNTGADIRDQDAVGQINGTGYMAVGINTAWNVIHFKGLVVMGTTSGSITQLWAPSGGGTATVYTNSYMGAKLAEN